MPELPEVETVRRGLAQTTVGKTITGGEVLLARTVAAPEEPAVFLEALRGCTLTDWQRRGKYLLCRLERRGEAAGWWGAHLRMTGQFLWTTRDQPLQRHTRVRLFCEGDRELRFIDMRTFGQLWWVPPGQAPETVITGLKKLGPEPFSADFSERYFRQALARSRRPIKTALLDQSLVAGVGNIYADESLHMTGLHPTLAADRLTAAQVRDLRAAVVAVLEASIGAGGTTFSDFRDLEGVNGNYGGQARVYNRTGQPCPVCATPIERLKLAGRSAHFCPRCQPRPRR